MSDYVEEFYQTYVEAEREKMLDAAAKELQERSPPPMNSMLEKEERQVAVERREARQKMTVADVPPTTPCMYDSEFYVMLKFDLCDYNWPKLTN